MNKLIRNSVIAIGALLVSTSGISMDKSPAAEGSARSCRR